MLYSSRFKNPVKLKIEIAINDFTGLSPAIVAIIALPLNPPSSDAVFSASNVLVKNRLGVRFLSDIANTYLVECDGHEAVLVNGHWMGTGYSAQSFTMMTLNADQARMVGFEFDDVRPLCRAVHIPTADRGQRGTLRIVR